MPPDHVTSTEDVRFAAPPWALRECTPPITTPMRVRRGGSFDDTWKHGLNAVAERLRRGWWTWPAVPTKEEGPLQAMMRERLATMAAGPGFDPGLEAYTLALVRHTNMEIVDVRSLGPRVLAYWTTRSDPATALETLLRGMSMSCFAEGDHRTLRALPREPTVASYMLPETVRDHVRQHGTAMLGPAVRRLCDDPVLACWILDDEAAAIAQVRRRDDRVPRAGHLVGLLPTAEDAAPLLADAQLGDGMRAIARHGAELSEAALALAGASKSHITFWACYPSRTAAEKLVAALGPKETRGLVARALTNMPEHARPALMEARARRAAHRDVIDALLATFDAQPTVHGPSDMGAGEAPESDLPRVLTSPPWRTKRRAPLPTFAGLVARPIEHAVDLTTLDPRSLEQELARRTPQVDEPWRNAGQPVGAYMIWGATFEQLEEMRVLGVLARVDAHYWTHTWYMSGLTVLLYRDGAKVVPALLQLAPALRPELACELAHVGAVEVAGMAVQWLRYKGARRAASEWVRRFPRHAAAGLLPIVFGADTPPLERERALTLFELLAEQRDVVVEEASVHGPEVLTAANMLIDRDPLESAPTKAPKLLEGVEALPRVKLRDGRALPERAQRHLLEMLAFSSMEAPYAGVAHVRDACDQGSLDAFLDALVDVWVAAGMRSAHAWAARAVAIVGSDRAARSLFDRGRAWARDGQKQHALLVLDVLGVIGSDLTLSLIGRMSRGGQRQYLKDRATGLLAEVAIARGLTTDELEDRTAPDLGLDEHGRLVLDFGPRRFHVGFDEHLRPFVRDQDGSQLAQLPRARKTDDPAKAKAAWETWKALRSEAEAAAKDQLARLARMMADERRIEAHVFVDCFAKHPLIGHLAARLVWGTFDADGGLSTAFRVTDERTLSTLDEAPFELPTDATVGLIHPLHLDAPEVGRWRSLLLDYDLVQPFGQLTRPRAAVSVEQLTARYQGVEAPSGVLYGLRALGWRALVGEEAAIVGFSRSFAHIEFQLHLSPRLTQAQPSGLHALRLVWRGDAASITAVQLAELLFQLDGVLVR